MKELEAFTTASVFEFTFSEWRYCDTTRRRAKLRLWRLAWLGKPEPCSSLDPYWKGTRILGHLYWLGQKVVPS